MDGLLINGQLYYVQTKDDFVDLVAKYMGMDSEKYLQNLLNDYDYHINALNDDISTLESELVNISDDCK